VLLIIALLAGLALPAMDSAFNERSLRNDAHVFSVMAKTAMLKSAEDQRPYTMELQGSNLVLEPARAILNDHDTVHADSDDERENPDSTTETETLSNPIKFPDANRKNKWETLPSVKWTFQPEDLCPLPRIRVERGQGYIEMSFNALTGDVEDEGYYLP